MYVTDISDRIDPFPIWSIHFRYPSHPWLSFLPFMIRMRAGSGLMERVTRNGYSYYIPFITSSLFISFQLLTSYFIFLLYYLNPCTRWLIPQFEDRLEYRSSSHVLPFSF